MANLQLSLFNCVYLCIANLPVPLSPIKRASTVLLSMSTMDRLLALLAVLAAACAACTCTAMLPPCTAVMYKILPCMGYLMDKHWTPDGTCCYGVVALNKTAEAWPARVVICDCLKDIATRFPHIDSTRSAELSLNFTLSPYIDCTTIPAP